MYVPIFKIFKETVFLKLVMFTYETDVATETNAIL